MPSQVICRAKPKSCNSDLKLVFIEIKDNLKKQELHLLCHPAKPINYKRQQCIPNDGDSFLISEKHTILQIRTSLGSYVRLQPKRYKDIIRAGIAQ